MKKEKNLVRLINSMNPILNVGDYVFCSINNIEDIKTKDIVMFFKEKEGVTCILNKKNADKLNLKYDFVSSWITLNVFSSLEAIGFTSFFTKLLSEQGISCNVVAAFHHDHIFVPKKETKKALQILKNTKS